MEPPLSESESEEGEASEDEDDQVDELIDDRPKLEQGEVGLGQGGRIDAALRSHVADYHASQASGVNSSSAFERRQTDRRARRANPLGADGRRTADRSERTGTGPTRIAGAGVRRPRSTHVPSMAGHLHQPTVVQPATAPKQYYPLSITTVLTWRTELERLASLCTRPGVFKNISQYASELQKVLKQIEANEENPDLTVEVLTETKLMMVLAKFRHCHKGAGPGIKSLVPVVKGICSRWRERLRRMETEGRAQEIKSGAAVGEDSTGIRGD